MELWSCRNIMFIFLTVLIAAKGMEALSESESESEESSIISRFQQYLKINTAQPNPGYKEAAEFLISEGKELSLESQSIEFVEGKPLVLLKWEGTNPHLPSILLYSHTDVVPSEHAKWDHHPFSAHLDSHGRIFARGSQDMKCVGMQYLEALRRLKARNFRPLRSLYLAFSPDEEIGGHDGAEKFAQSEIFRRMNVGVVLDEGLASPDAHYRAFYAERSPWWMVIKAVGAPGHGSKLYDNSAMENLLKSIESIRRFRASQLDLIKAGLKAEGDVVSVNMVFLKAGTPSPTGFVMNLQPSEAEAGFDIRVPPTADPESLERRIAEEWAPSSRNMSFAFKQKASTRNKSGKLLLTETDSSNPWWNLLGNAVELAGGKLGKPEVFPAATDSRYFRELGLPAIGFSPMANTPVLLHDHNEVRKLMKDSKVKKEPGMSWIEIKDKVYTFIVGDRSHSRSDEIYAKLDQLGNLLSKAGYSPVVEIDIHNVNRSEKEKLLYHHSEKLAVAFGLIATPPGAPIRVKKNLRICVDCHIFFKFVCKIVSREIIVRDINRFHHFKDGSCSCGDYW